jgi:hypothetical protein
MIRRAVRTFGASVPLASFAVSPIGASIPNIRLADPKCQFFGVLFTF